MIRLNKWSAKWSAKLWYYEDVRPVGDSFEDLEKLQYAIFPQLQVLKIRRACPEHKLLIDFLEKNGKILKEFYVGDIDGYSDNSLNLAIAKFCPKLRKLSTGFIKNELETLKLVFNNCQYLERIKIWCGEYLRKGGIGGVC